MPRGDLEHLLEGQGGSGGHLGGDRERLRAPRGRPGVARGAPGGSGTVRRGRAGAAAEHREAAAEHREAPPGGIGGGRRREGEANASRNRRNRLLEKARHVSRRDTAD